MHDIERQRLGVHALIGGELRLDHHLLAAPHPLARPGRLAGEAHCALPDPALQARARVLRQRGGQRLVQAQSGRRGRQLEQVGLELRWHRAGQLYWVD